MLHHLSPVEDFLHHNSLIKNSLFAIVLPLLIYQFHVNEAYGQKSYFQQKVDIRMDITLDDQLHLINGNWEMKYFNNSPDSLPFIYIHLWPNAYSNNATAFGQQQIKLNQTDFYFAPQESRGYISGLNFTVGEEKLKWEYVDGQIDIGRLFLPYTLLPGDSITISSPFTVKIPESFSRLGRAKSSYQLTQWYPKPAVYDQDGWHPMSYLELGEFYSEFGDYEVSITLPEDYFVGATGVLQEDSEKDRVRRRVLETRNLKSAIDQNLEFSSTHSSPKMKTITYKAELVHDFAWFADKRFLIDSDTLNIAGHRVEATVMYLPDNADVWKDALFFVSRAVQFYSDKVGPYPYPQVTAVDGALSAGGGMEYPMITIIGESNNAEELDRVITHEVGHNWFYGILAFNERDYAWMDEGINSFYEQQYMDAFYSTGSLQLPRWLISDSRMSIGEFAYQYKSSLSREVAPCRHVKLMGNLDYFIGAYEKPAMSLHYLKDYLGKESFDLCMKGFYEDWKFKHPQPNDFRHFFETCTGEDLSWFFEVLICSEEKVDMFVTKKGKSLYAGIHDLEDFPFKVTFSSGDSIITQEWYKSNGNKIEIKNPDHTIDQIEIDPNRHFWDSNRRNNKLFRDGESWKRVNTIKFRAFTGIKDQKTSQIFILPVMGANSYDGFQIGAAFHNIGLPMGAFEYYLAPMYGFRSNALTGLADVGYYFYLKNGFINSLRIGMNFRSFQERERVIPASSQLLNLRYARAEISAELDLKTRLSSNYQSKLKIRNLRINNEIWDPPVSGSTSDETRYLSTSIYELRYTFARRSQISPFSLITALEYQDYTTAQRPENYLKLWAEFITKYSIARDKYFTIRAFAGTFLLNTHRDLGFINAGSGRGNFSLFGNSALDYRYDEFFIGRGRLSGLGAQQMSISDGGFKNAITPIFDDGVTNNYLLALNLSSDLSQFPEWLPLRLYFDVGYTDSFAGRVAQGPFDPNLFWSGGVELSLIRGFLSIYIPVVNSENINRFYGEMGSFWRRVSFSWKFGHRKPGTIAREIEFLGLF